MKEYICVRNNVHIFDLRITLEFSNALLKIHETVQNLENYLLEQKNGAGIVKDLPK